MISISSHPSLPTKLRTEPLRATCCCHPHLSRTDSDITYSRTDLVTTPHISTLALSGKKVLCVLQSQGQAACWMAGSQEKTTYRSAPFPSGGGGAGDASQRKITRGATSEVVKETAGWTRPDMTHKMSISASIRPLLCGGGPPSLCGGGPSSLCDEDGRRSRHNSR